MKITKLTSLEEGQSFMQKVAITAIICAFAAVLGMFYLYSRNLKAYASGYVEHMTNNQWVIDQSNGHAFKMNLEPITSDGRKAEYGSLLVNVYHSFYAFTPLDDFEHKINKGLFLVSKEIGDRIVDLHDKNELEVRLKSEDMSVYIHFDSIDYKRNIVYARQRIEKPKGNGMRNLWFEFEIQDIHIEGTKVIKRTNRNSTGAIITKWKLINNNKIKYTNKSLN